MGGGLDHPFKQQRSDLSDNLAGTRIDVMIEWLKQRLLPDAKVWWRLASTRFQMLAAGALAAVIANPDVLLSAAWYLPEGPLRLVVAALIGLAYFAGDRLLRLWREERLPTSEELSDGQ